MRSKVFAFIRSKRDGSNTTGGQKHKKKSNQLATGTVTPAKPSKPTKLMNEHDTHCPTNNKAKTTERFDCACATKSPKQPETSQACRRISMPKVCLGAGVEALAK